MWGGPASGPACGAGPSMTAGPELTMLFLACLASPSPCSLSLVGPGRQRGQGAAPGRRRAAAHRRRRPPAYTNLPCQCTALPAAAGPREPPNWSLGWGGAGEAVAGNNLQPSAGGRAPACGPQSTVQHRRCSTRQTVGKALQHPCMPSAGPGGCSSHGLQAVGGHCRGTARRLSRGREASTSNRTVRHFSSVSCRVTHPERDPQEHAGGRYKYCSRGRVQQRVASARASWEG